MKLSHQTSMFLLISLLLHSFFILSIDGLTAPSESDSLMENNIPTLFIAGNSTASNGTDKGWGSHLKNFFDSNKLIVTNQARAGQIKKDKGTLTFRFFFISEYDPF